MNFLNQHILKVGDGQDSPFMNRNDVFQDGTTPMYRDVDGTLWAMSGHSHMGRIAMFAGKTLSDMTLKYYIGTNFGVGHADYAFSGIRYPEGIRARGSIWPFGLYICPNTHRFFCFFHNETGWAAQGTNYDSRGICGRPAFDSDFRHIGLMHSDDEGKNWVFDRWVMTANTVAATDQFIPDGVNIVPQASGRICLGSGDFSCFIDDEYIYLFYNMSWVNMDTELWEHCNVYVARTRKRCDGVMGDFVKYYDGSFCEAGNLGRESVIVADAWHPRVIHMEKYGVYLMTASDLQYDNPKQFVADVMAIRVSTDLIHWSDKIIVEKDGKPFGNHYVAMVSDDGVGQPNVATGDEVKVLTNHNGTDVLIYPSRWVEN